VTSEAQPSGRGGLSLHVADCVGMALSLPSLVFHYFGLPASCGNFRQSKQCEGFRSAELVAHREIVGLDGACAGLVNVPRAGQEDRFPDRGQRLPALFFVDADNFWLYWLSHISHRTVV